MSGDELSQSYDRMAASRLAGLEFFLGRGDFAIVIREAQECVELALKGLLRRVGVEPLKIHDVSRQLREASSRLPASVADKLDCICAISARLRKDREFAFYGDVDLIPTEAYGRDEAQRAFEDARLVVECTRPGTNA